MSRSLLVKAIVTGFLAVALVLPLVAIGGLVQGRRSSKEQVLEDIQRAGVGSQTLTGPILVVPFRRTVRTEVTEAETGKRTTVTRQEEGQQYLLPDSLSAEVAVGTELRHRGIYSALLYDARHELHGSFSVPERYGVAESPNSDYEFLDAFLMLAIRDTRGIRGAPALRWDGTALEWKGGTEGAVLATGVNATLGRIEPGSVHSFDVEIELQGTESLAYVPVGKETSLQMRSSWPHPSFQGQLLPETRAISAEGFEAAWHTSHLASGVEPALRGCLSGRDCSMNELAVSFIEPVDVYRKTDRAVKYGFLFVAITFVVFLLFELLEGLAIHPVQYGLVGMALALFFLLLLALAEHVPFGLAYAVASSACVGLLAFYVSFVLHSVRRAAGFTTLLAALYAMLFLLLRSEDMALLLGALLLFAILAAVMALTRRVDWYRIAGRSETGANVV